MTVICERCGVSYDPSRHSPNCPHPDFSPSVLQSQRNFYDARLSFRDLAVGDRFSFKWEQGESRIAVKTGERTYESDDFYGRVGVGDNPVVRR